MTSRERILNAIEFKPTDRIPLDLAGMRCTGISAFALPGLVKDFRPSWFPPPR